VFYPSTAGISLHPPVSFLAYLLLLAVLTLSSGISDKFISKLESREMRRDKRGRARQIPR